LEPAHSEYGHPCGTADSFKERRFTIAVCLAGGFKPPLLEAARRSQIFEIRISSLKTSVCGGVIPAP
jgi:hypothetical protein